MSWETDMNFIPFQLFYPGQSRHAPTSCRRAGQLPPNGLLPLTECNDASSSYRLLDLPWLVPRRSVESGGNNGPERQLTELLSRRQTKHGPRPNLSILLVLRWLGWPTRFPSTNAEELSHNKQAHDSSREPTPAAIRHSWGSFDLASRNSQRV